MRVPPLFKALAMAPISNPNKKPPRAGNKKHGISMTIEPGGRTSCSKSETLKPAGVAEAIDELEMLP